jgi:hypothetical protein
MVVLLVLLLKRVSRGDLRINGDIGQLEQDQVVCSVELCLLPCLDKAFVCTFRLISALFKFQAVAELCPDVC